MAKSRCIKTRFNREILCAGTMTDFIEIVKRVSGTTEPGQSMEPVENFTAVSDYAGYLEAVKDVPRWNGVSMEDQSASNFTHVVYIPYEEEVFELDRNTLFVKFTGSTRSRYFKMKKIADYHEQEEYIHIELAETGFTDLVAAHG